MVFAVKLYPAGATTNSDSGVTDFSRVQPTLQKMVGPGPRSPSRAPKPACFAPLNPPRPHVTPGRGRDAAAGAL